MEENHMKLHESKVVVVGCGNVGATVAYSLVNQGTCGELVLLDVNKDKAYAEALDIQHSLYFMNRNITVKTGDYSECEDADIVVITASAPMPKDSHNRLEMLTPSLKIIRNIVQSVMSSGFSGIFIVVSNPVDIMSYYVWKLSGLPSNQIIGSGTALDTARLCCELSELYSLDSKSVQSYILGEHGDTEFIAWSTALIGGKYVSDVMADNTDRTKDVTRESLLKQTKEAGWEIFNRKGNTCYGIASSTTAIIKSILFNENRILPVSVCLHGQYGLMDMFISVPTILNKHGAREIVEIRLADDEKEALMKSAEAIRNFYADLQI